MARVRNMAEILFGRRSDCSIRRTCTESRAVIGMTCCRWRPSIWIYLIILPLRSAQRFLTCENRISMVRPALRGVQGAFGRFLRRVSKAWLTAHATKTDRKIQPPRTLLSPRGSRASARSSTRSSNATGGARPPAIGFRSVSNGARFPALRRTGGGGARGGGYRLGAGPSSGNFAVGDDRISCCSASSPGC